MRKIVANNKIGILFFLIFSSALCYSQNNSENLLKEAKESAKKALEVGANIFA